MTQRDLNRAVARVTGESVDVIERMGFGPVEDTSGDASSAPSGEFSGDHGPSMIDWDAGDDARLAVRSVRRRRLATAI
ncbi:MAG TPA: hypothetical protein VGM05_11460 [Planctomycetaceae bacterium]|jgi:hypothetical protein